MKKVKKVLTLLFCFAFVLTGITPFAAEEAHAAAKTASITYESSSPYDGWTAQFKISGLNGTGLCAYDAKPAAKPGTKGTLTPVTDKRVIKIMYYCIYKRKDTITKRQARDCHRAVSYYISGKNSLHTNAKNGLQDALNYVSTYTAKAMPPASERFEVWLFTPNDSKYQTVVCYNIAPIQYGYIRVLKKSTDTNSYLTGKYSFAGAEYSVYKSDKTTKVDTLKITNTKKTGNVYSATSKALEEGSYYIKETKAPADGSYSLSSSWIPVTVKKSTVSTPITVTATDAPKPGYGNVKKTLSDDSDAGGAVAGFTFRFDNTKSTAIAYVGTTGADGSISSFKDKAGNTTKGMLAGTYKVTEVIPKDRLANYSSVTSPQTITIEQGKTVNLTWKNRYTVHEDLTISKTTTDNGSAEGFTFDVKGRLFNSKELTAAELVKLAAPVIYDENDDEVTPLAAWTPAESLDALNADAKDGKRGGDYTFTLKTKVKEIRTLETATVLYDDGTLVFNAIKKDIDQSKAVETYDPVDDKTTAAAGEKWLAHADEITNVKNEASVKGATADKLGLTVENFPAGLPSIDLSSDKSLDDPVEVPVSVTVKVTLDSINGTTAASGRSEAASGDYTIILSKSATFAGAATTVEYNGLVTDENGKIYIRDIEWGHYTVTERMTDIQKLRYSIADATIERDLIDRSSDNNFVFAFENEARWTPVELIKTSEDGNIEGIEFTLKGDTSFGEPVEITRETDENGKIDFGNIYKGEYVITESAFDEDEYIFFDEYRLSGYDKPSQKLIVTGDEKDTIKVDFKNVPKPEIGTTLRDTDSGEHTSFANTTVSLTDTVEYKRLIPGKEYTVTGKLMDKETEKVLCDDKGKEITAEAKFTPDTPDGTVDVVFVFSGLTVAGKTAVAFEDLYKDGDLVATHADLEDEDQTVIFPGIRTTATDSYTGEHIAMADDNVTINDEVTYMNLVKGQIYELSGEVVFLKENGEPKDASAEGYEAPVATIKFEATGTSGSVMLPITFNASKWAGYRTVVYETLSTIKKDGSTHTVAIHQDPTDKGQTVELPKIGTTAKESAPAGEGEVTDTVRYTHLIPGRTYTLSGSLIEKSTLRTICTAKKTFTAKTSSGNVDVVFKSRDLVGRNVVAFETLYLGKTTDKKLQVAAHADINDTDQTVKLLGIGRITLNDDDLFGIDRVKTGDPIAIGSLVLLIAAFTGSLSIAAYMILKRKKEASELKE